MSRVDIRLTGKDLFIYYHKKLGIIDKNIRVGGCTNKRLLSKRTGIGEGLLMRIFTRRGFCYYENEDTIILKVRTSDIEKGSQSVARKGRGGMDKFIERYVIKKRDDNY